MSLLRIKPEIGTTIPEEDLSIFLASASSAVKKFYIIKIVYTFTLLHSEKVSLMAFFRKILCGKTAALHFTPSAELLNSNQFWHILHLSRNSSENSFESCGEGLRKLLVTSCSAQEIILFNNRYNFYLGQFYQWKVWHAVDIIYQGCSQQQWAMFADWSISQGKFFYHNLLAEPDAIASMDMEVFRHPLTGLSNIAALGFEELTNKKLPKGFVPDLQLSGDAIPYESLHLYYPRLSKKYGVPKKVVTVV